MSRHRRPGIPHHTDHPARPRGEAQPTGLEPAADWGVTAVVGEAVADASATAVGPAGPAVDPPLSAAGPATPSTETQPPAAVGDTVLILRPTLGHEIGDAVITDAQPYKLPTEGGGLTPCTLYRLQFACGGHGWYLRHKFHTIGGT